MFLTQLCFLPPERRQTGLLVRACDHRSVLKELRGSHGGPHAGTRLLALGLALLLAAPLTVFAWRLVASLVQGLV